MSFSLRLLLMNTAVIHHNCCPRKHVVSYLPVLVQTLQCLLVDFQCNRNDVLDSNAARIAAIQNVGCKVPLHSADGQVVGTQLEQRP